MGSLIRLLATTAWLALGCSAERANRPEDAVTRYANALESGDSRLAWGLLDEETRRMLPYEQFAAQFQRAPLAVRALAKALRRPGRQSKLQAEWQAPDGTPLRFERVNGQWLLTADSLNPYPQQEPRLAVESFLRAAAARRYDILVRFTPNALRPGLDAERLRVAWEGPQKENVAIQLERLRSALSSGRLTEYGDRASLELGAPPSIELVREDGTWRIEDFAP